MQAVIMAGGKGTRLVALTKDQVPKPMAQIAKRPILEWQIEQLKNNGITDIILVIGHLGEKIKKYFGDGSKFGVNLRYFHETTPLGSAGALYYVRSLLEEGAFFLIFGDIIFDIDMARMLRFHQDKKAVVTLFAHPNSHPFDSDLIVTDTNDKVIEFDSKNNDRIGYWYDNLVNAGVYLLERSFCERIKKPVKTDLEKDLLFFMAQKKEALVAYCSPEYVKDVGTPERIGIAEKEINNGFAAARNLKNEQKAIFLDRDGTINKYKGLIWKQDDFELYHFTIEAIRKINRSGYLAIVITNQPVVARGLCQLQDVENIHKKLETLLGKEGAFLDDIKFCPHHPDKGYPEENPIYKVPCSCRKPNIGMIQECVEKYNIDLSQSWFVGDTTTDIQTGKNAGMRTVLVQTGEAGKDGKYENTLPDMTCTDLLDAVRRIREEQ
ncbi:HAD-IIIA family hydrolase [Aminipila luticellarii]|uniref:HAD-IIIA family hydrolase n=1 Tax=Aminipila luticellarii TaxID=2507160 RepID=A0A410PSL8_9FIRM|nr:HAD-IIIA family hydrolase [Aminipila luticellarii]QAT41914.1 HAD-IIIA family hydrolase [Aminipila luticellarii]